MRTFVPIMKHSVRSQSNNLSKRKAEAIPERQLRLQNEARPQKAAVEDEEFAGVENVEDVRDESVKKPLRLIKLAVYGKKEPQGQSW